MQNIFSTNLNIVIGIIELGVFRAIPAVVPRLPGLIEVPNFLSFRPCPQRRSLGRITRIVPNVEILDGILSGE